MDKIWCIYDNKNRLRHACIADNDEQAFYDWYMHYRNDDASRLDFDEWLSDVERCFKARCQDEIKDALESIIYDCRDAPEVPAIYPEKEKYFPNMRNIRVISQMMLKAFYPQPTGEDV